MSVESLLHFFNHLLCGGCVADMREGNTWYFSHEVSHFFVRADVGIQQAVSSFRDNWHSTQQFLLSAFHELTIHSDHFGLGLFGLRFVMLSLLWLRSTHEFGPIAHTSSFGLSSFFRFWCSCFWRLFNFYFCGLIFFLFDISFCSIRFRHFVWYLLLLY